MVLVWALCVDFVWDSLFTAVQCIVGCGRCRNFGGDHWDGICVGERNPNCIALSSCTELDTASRHSEFCFYIFGLRTAIVALTLGVMVITSIGLMQHSITDQIEKVSHVCAHQLLLISSLNSGPKPKSCLRKRCQSFNLHRWSWVGFQHQRRTCIGDCRETQPDTQRWAYTVSRDCPRMSLDPELFWKGDSMSQVRQCPLFGDTVRRTIGVTIGDSITFDIQGIRLSLKSQPLVDPVGNHADEFLLGRQSRNAC